MIVSGVYTIINKKSGGVYIGSTNDFEKRWGEHRGELRLNKHYNPHLQHSWNKYGEDAFDFGVLEYLDNLDDLVKAEQFWMDLYREEGRQLYNIAIVVDNPMQGRQHTEETRCRMSEVRMGIVFSEEHKCRLSKSAKQRPLPSEETKQKIGVAGVGRTHTEETKQKMSKSRKGMKRGPMSEETKRKISAGNKGKKHSKEAKRRMSIAQRGRKHSKNIGARTVNLKSTLGQE